MDGEWTKVDGEWVKAGTEADGRRECRACGVVKSLELFRVNSGCRGGRSRTCGACMTAADRRREAKRKAAVVLATPERMPVDVDAMLHQLHAACVRWHGCEDQEERGGARDAAVYRARQLMVILGG